MSANPANAREWLAAQTPVIEGWKAEDAAFESYCKNRDMGIKAEALARFFTPYWAGDFEARYRGDKLLAEYDAERIHARCTRKWP